MQRSQITSNKTSLRLDLKTGLKFCTPILSGSHGKKKKKVSSNILLGTEIGNKCQNDAKKRLKEEIQEVAASLAGAKEISIEAAVVALSL